MILLFNLFPTLSWMEESSLLGGDKVAENVPNEKVYNISVQRGNVWTAATVTLLRKAGWGACHSLG